MTPKIKWDWFDYAMASIIGVVLVAGLASLPRRVHASEPTTIARKLLSGVSALNSAVATGNMANSRACAVYADWSAGVASGAVIVETAVDQNYTGTWAPVSGTGLMTFGGSAPNQQVFYITSPLWAVRTRVSTVLAGGTVSTWIVCN